MLWMQSQYMQDSTLLYRSLENLDSIDCVPVAHRAFKLKSAILSLLNHYDEGISYVESFDSTYFEFPYGKKVYVGYFKAMKASFMGDTIQAILLYKDIIANIQAYLDKHSPNEVTLMELFAIKLRIESKEELIRELKDLKKQGKYDSPFIEKMIESIENMDNALFSLHTHCSQATINIPKSQLVYGTTPSSLQVRGNWFVSTPGGMTPVVRHSLMAPYAISFKHTWTFK
jgi:hypothetical protein